MRSSSPVATLPFQDRSRSWGVALCASIACFACGAGEEPDPRGDLHNPVIGRLGLADPAVIAHEGTYYLYATGDSRGFDVYTSRDLYEWVEGPRAIDIPGGNVWAPDVFRDPVDGQFYLYYSANYRVGVAKAASPIGPFNDLGILIEGAIDPHMFRDRDGRYYLYYEKAADAEATLRSWRRPTGRIFVQPMSNPSTRESQPRLLLSPDSSWERGWIFRVVEGPWMLERDGEYFLMYSGNAAFSADYAIGYAVGKSPLGPFVKHPGNPIIARGGGVLGPGHHSVVEGPDGELHIVYHQKATARLGWDRFICVDRLLFTPDGRLEADVTPMRDGIASKEELDRSVIRWW